jgi:RHS repeat-associated protein
METERMGLNRMNMRISKVICIETILFVGLMFNTQFVAGILDASFEKSLYGNSLDRAHHFALNDAVPSSQDYYGYTPVPEYESLEIHKSNDPLFEYMAASPYYKVYFRGNTVRMCIGNSWIEYDLENIVVEEAEEQLTSEEPKIPGAAESVVDQNTLSVFNVFESVDVSYTVDTSLLTETLVLKGPTQCTEIVQNVKWEGISPEYQEDGSILFLDENGENIARILPPFMEDAAGIVCGDIHYELVETESGYELRKVINEKGLEWLQQAAYPVVLDPSIETLEDAWESSGLTPYGQYFKSLKEYVNPANGLLTITQTDLIILGRGMDLVISRVYQTPAVFYGSYPYDYEYPPVTVGKGWQLDFPFVGSKYLHLWGGTVYKISWMDSTFENHVGSHFTLVENGDSTYTLTTADGTVYEFDTSGKLIQIKDLDQNTITFSYTSGNLTTITDTIGRTVSLTYSNNRLWKIAYDNCELEYSYVGDGCLQWVEDFLDRRTSYYYESGYNVWLVSKIQYPTTGYTTYSYGRFEDSYYYKYYITDQRVYETNQVRHAGFSYTGSFSEISASEITVKNESDVIKGSYCFTIRSDGLITERIVKNASGAALRKYAYTYSKKEVTQESVYNDGSNLSYTNYYAYDNWGNIIYVKSAEGHEKFFSYANTDTSGFFIDNNKNIIQQFTNAFSDCTVPPSVHTALIGTAEKQDATYVREAYHTYDSEAHLTQVQSSFGAATSWLTYSGTYNKQTGDTSFPIDLTGHSVSGDGVLQIIGLESGITYSETHSSKCPLNQYLCPYSTVQYSWWSGTYCKVHWFNYRVPTSGTSTNGPFTHYPGTFGYVSYTTSAYSATTYWKAYPAEVKYNIDASSWKTIATDLKNSTATLSCPISDGSHMLNFSESSDYYTKFSWVLYVPVDNSPDTYGTSMQYDTYGNISSITDTESNITTFAYSSDYSHAYLTEISATVGPDTITTKAAYNYDRGWITSMQEPKGVAGSGYDTLYSYDVLGRVVKKEFPLLSGQSQRHYIEAVYDDTDRTVTVIDQFRHYIVQEYDNLGRLTAVNVYAGEYGSGTLYATTSHTYRYDDRVETVTDSGSHTYTYTYDFLKRTTQIQYPDSSSVSYSYDDTNRRITFTNGRGYDRIYWHDWLSRLTKVEEEYETDLFAVTTYQYDENNHLTSFTDAENHTTTYEYASLFGLTKTTYPDSKYEEYQYNSVGDIISITDCRGNQTTYAYDSLYRLTQIEYQDQSAVSFTYDLNSNRSRMDDDALNAGDYAEYTYDEWNRLTSKTRHISYDAYTVSYQYDAANRLIELTYPDSTQILYTYDDLNRMTQIRRYVDGVNDEMLMDSAQYTTENLLTQFVYGNELIASFSYDLRDRLLTLEVKDGSTSYLDLGYTYDYNSNITQIVNEWRDTSFTLHSDTESYTYDGLDRLTSASCTSWSHVYSYDEVGNRTGKDGITYTVNVVNEVTELSDGTSFTYDDNGNRIQKTKGTDTWEYTYDYADRLTEVEENGSITGEYGYDGDGKRIRATEDSLSTTSVYSGLNVVFEETPVGTATYIYGPGGRLAKRTTVNQETDTFYYHTDHLGSTRLVTDSGKTIVSAAVYHPFGEADIEGSESYLFTGKEKEATGLYYYGARYYDPELGTFISRDPIKGRMVNPQTLNRYTYCQNNPTKYVDPWGEWGILHDIGDPGELEEEGLDEETEEIVENNLSSGESSRDKEYYRLLAILEILHALGYNDAILNERALVIELKIEGIPVEITAEETLNEDLYNERGLTTQVEEGETIKIEIYFSKRINISAAELYQSIGHEMEHAKHKASGDYYRWGEKYTPWGAYYRSEMYAYQWNLNHLGYNFPGGFEIFWTNLREFTRAFNEIRDQQ